MGLQDRDYMHERHRRTPGRGRRNDAPIYLSQQPERHAAGTLLKVLVVLVVLFALYKGSARWLTHREAERASAAAVRTSPPPPPPQATTSPSPRQPMPALTARTHPAPPAPGPGVVMKCQGAGGTTYSDVPCPAGTRATSVTLPVEVLSVGASVRPQNVPAPAAQPTPIAPAPQVIVVQNGPSIHEQRQLECKALDVEITHLDAWARQPQSGQTQDHIRDRRKQARDRQFALHC